MPACTGFGDADFVTARPAAVTVTVALELLFASVDSGLVVDAVAVLEMTVPPRLLVLLLTTNENWAVAPAASDAIVQ